MRADRLLSIMFILQAQGKTTTHTLAEKLEVSRRTILRDIDALSIAGVPIHADAGHGGGVYLDEHYRVSLNGLNEAEVRAMFVSSSSSPLRDVGLGQAADDTLLKLFAGLPSLHRREAERIKQRILLDPAWWWDTDGTISYLDIFKEAVFEDYRVQVRYERGNGRVIESIIEPYSLVAKASIWYLVAKSDGNLRTYRMSRFHKAQRLSEHFEREPAFDLTQYWEAHVAEFVASVPEYAFTLRVDASRLKFLRLYAAGRHTIRDTSDDETKLIVDMRFSSPEEAQMMVLGLGTDADVIEPDDLRKAVLLQAKQIVSHLS
ncbi:MAG: WYL domain-containing protein [Chloroflexota bacterium]